MARFPLITPEGDSAVHIRFDDHINSKSNTDALQFAHFLSLRNYSFILDIIPAYCTVMVCYNALECTFGELEARLFALLAEFSREENGFINNSKHVEIPVCYEPEFAPDLEELARSSGLGTQDVIKRHSGSTYHIDMLGFLPGFAYLSGLDPVLEMPRLAEPRAHVPAGSIGIGGSQTGIYSVTSPGGWRIIGRTPLNLVGNGWPPQLLYAPGDTVTFTPINSREFDRTQAHEELIQASAQASSNQDAEKPACASIISPGVYTTVQYAPAYGWQAQGIRPQGPMDMRSFALANALVGNGFTAPVLEFVYKGPELLLSEPCVFAVTGAPFEVFLNNKPVEPYEAIYAPAQSILSIRSAQRGHYGYLAIHGGITFAGSIPREANGCTSRIKNTGTELRFYDPDSQENIDVLFKRLSNNRLLSKDAYFTWNKSNVTRIRVVCANHSQSLGSQELSTFFDTVFEITSRADRMGVCLTAQKPLGINLKGIISEGIACGTIQIPSNGMPIVVTADHQTCGGYPKAGTIATVDLPRFVQLNAGDKVKFEPVSLEEAQKSLAVDAAYLTRLSRHWS